MLHVYYKDILFCIVFHADPQLNLIVTILVYAIPHLLHQVFSGTN
jgi:hypothetical protein